MGQTQSSFKSIRVICCSFELTHALEELPLLSFIGNKLAKDGSGNKIFLIISKALARFYRDVDFPCELWEADPREDQGILASHRLAVEKAQSWEVAQYFALNPQLWAATLGMALKAKERIGISSGLVAHLFTVFTEENPQEHFLLTWERIFKLLKWENEPLTSPPIFLGKQPLKNVTEPYVVFAIPWMHDHENTNFEFDMKKWMIIGEDLEEKNIVFVGPVRGSEKWHKLSNDLRTLKKVTNLIGFLNPYDLLKLLQEALGVLSPDPMLGRLCNLVHTPCAVLNAKPILNSPLALSTSFRDLPETDGKVFVDHFYRKVDEIRFS